MRYDARHCKGSTGTREHAGQARCLAETQVSVVHGIHRLTADTYCTIYIAQRLSPLRFVTLALAVPQQLLEAAAHQLNDDTPRVSQIRSLLAIIGFHGLTNSRRSVFASDVAHSIRVRHGQADMEDATALILLLECPVLQVRLLDWRVDELEKLKADTVTGREPGDSDFVQLVPVDLSQVVRAFRMVHLSVRPNAAEPEVLAVPFYGFVEVWNGQGDVVEDVVLVVMRVLNGVSKV